MAARGTACPGEALGEDAALQIATKLALDRVRDRASIPIFALAETERGLELGLDDLVQDGLRRIAGR
jgi:hypothetical protein